MQIRLMFDSFGDVKSSGLRGEGRRDWEGME